jgi:hypothetical protein
VLKRFFRQAPVLTRWSRQGLSLPVQPLRLQVPPSWVRAV